MDMVVDVDSEHNAIKEGSGRDEEVLSNMNEEERVVWSYLPKASVPIDSETSSIIHQEIVF